MEDDRRKDAKGPGKKTKKIESRKSEDGHDRRPDRLVGLSEIEKKGELEKRRQSGTGECGKIKKSISS